MMPLGVNFPTMFSSVAASCCLILLLLTSNRVNGRPQESSRDASSDSSAESKQTSDWWRPTSDKDKWRAFEPSKEIEFVRWWEQKLDDNLWDIKSYEKKDDKDKENESGSQEGESSEESPVVTSKPVTVVTEKSLDTLTDKPNYTDKHDNLVTDKPVNTDAEKTFGSKVTGRPDDSPTTKVENLATAKPKTVAPDAVTEATTATVKPTTTPSVQRGEPSYSGTYFRKGELNTFVEPDPGTYYRPSKTYGTKFWESDYADSYDSLEAKGRTETKNLQEKKSEKDESPEAKSQSENQNIQERKSEKDMKTQASTPTEGPAKTKVVDEVVHEDMTTRPAKANLTTTPPRSSDEVKVTSNLDKVISDEDEADDVQSVSQESNSIYGKGESIASTAMGVMVKRTGETSDVSKNTRKPEDKMSKGSEEFVDWADWDNSVFEGYEDDEEDNDDAMDKKEEMKKGEEKPMVEKKTKVKENAKVEENPEEKTKIVEKMKVEEKAKTEIEEKPKVEENPEAESKKEEKPKLEEIPKVVEQQKVEETAVKEENTKVEEYKRVEVKITPEPVQMSKNVTVVTENKDVNFDEDEEEEDDDDDDDEYYDDWDTDWDEDEEDDDFGKVEGQYKKKESIIEKATMTPTKEKKEKKDKKQRNITTVPKPKVKKFPNLESMALQSDEPAKHMDHSHYSKGVIYDSNYPNHKPSVKKDLNNPADNKAHNRAENDDELSGPAIKTDFAKSDTVKETISMDKTKISPKPVELKEVSQIDEKMEVKKSFAQTVEPASPSKHESAEIDGAQTGLTKKESSVTHFQGSQLNTESDASTSPNPPPPGLATDKGSVPGASPSTTPGPSKKLAPTTSNPDDQETVVDDGYVISYPLEFCQGDFECRAGRTCVRGVCKCVLPSVCSGHHKPICGSDGVKYASHCEMHRTACVKRVHIRADRKGRCFQKELVEKEKAWLKEHEQESQSAKGDKSQTVDIPSREIYQFPQDIKKDEKTADVKKAYTVNDEPAGLKQPVTTTTGPSQPKECTWKEMGHFKEALLLYYCQKFVEPNCKMEVKTDREYLSMLMFSYYDQNFDYYLTAAELDDKEREEHFAKNIIISCHLHDFVKFADTTNADGKITVTEFTHAFELPSPTAAPHTPVEVISTLASAGNGLELKCGVDATNVIWKRHGAQLTDDKHNHQLMVFDDGALFFSKVGLHHVGNYTCMDADDETNMQVHRLRVQTLPVVTVNPVTQTHVTGSDVELRCHAEGVPKPSITWKQGGEPLQNSPRATHYFGGGHIVIHNAQFDTDSGTYTCSAHNQAGTTEKSISVSVLPPTAPITKESIKESGTFLVFTAKGIHAYDPLRCLLKHQVPGDFSNFKFIPDALDGPLTLCRSGHDCLWGGAVKVGTEYIYANQPDQHRVVIVETGDTWSPVQVIDTDKRPIKLWYVKHLDQVWVLCTNTDENQEDSEGTNTIVVIRDASQHIQHRSVHTRPVGNHFDTVEDLFIAKPNDLDHEFDFGYVTHAGQNGLFKISLEDMSYTKSIDLSTYGCVPKNIDFVPIGGHVLIQCVSSTDNHMLQLTMDYLTDTITSTVSLSGRPMTSPDSRHLVIVDEFTGKVTVSSISDEGIMETTYEVTVSASISDVAFMPATLHLGYDLVLTSADDDDVILMNLVTGKVEKVAGTQYSDPATQWHPSPYRRHIVPGNSMSNFLMTPSKSSLAILDVKFKQVECEFFEPVGSPVMLYVASTKTS